MSEKVSVIRQNYSEDAEAAINRQINVQLNASYVYMSMAYHFDRDDVSFAGMHEYFKKKSDAAREHAEKLMSYQNLRGGRIVFQDIKAPPVEWKSHTHALEDALSLERNVNSSILEISKLANDKTDVHLCHFVNSTFVKEEVDSISKFSNLITNAKRCGNDLGIYEFDIHSMS